VNTSILDFPLKSINTENEISKLLGSELFLNFQNNLGLTIEDNSGYQTLTYNALKKITKCYSNIYHSGFTIALNIVKYKESSHILVSVLKGKKISVFNKISLENLDESKLIEVSKTLETLDFYDNSYDEYDEYSNYELTAEGIMTYLVAS
jgi:hypothetical protein